MARPCAVEAIIIKEACKNCGKTYEFRTRNFRWCMGCSTYYCKNCVPPCESCLTRDVCLLCAERYRDKYKSVLRIHLCEQCARMYSRSGTRNP